jgi:cell division protein FtsA
VYYEIKNSGLEKKLIAGIVVTGGGAQLRHIVQLVEYITGMDTRVGYPNEHLAKGADELKSPMYATAVGLVIKGFMELDRKKKIVQPAKEDKGVKTATKTQGTFFDSIKKWFEEDAEV